MADLFTYFLALIDVRAFSRWFFLASPFFNTPGVLLSIFMYRWLVQYIGAKEWHCLNIGIETTYQLINKSINKSTITKLNTFLDLVGVPG